MIRALSDVCRVHAKSVVVTSLLAALSALGPAADARALPDEELAPEDEREVLPKYPWGPEDCDAVYEFRANGASVDLDNPYLVAPGQPVYPTFVFRPPWGRESLRAVAIHPLIDNPAIVRRVILSNVQGGFQISSWASSREFSPRPSALSDELPYGNETLSLTVSYDNQSEAVVGDRSGFAVCVDDLD